MPIISENAKNRIKTKLEELQPFLPSDSDKSPNDLDDIVQVLDAHERVPYEMIVKFLPQTNEFHDWINFAFAVTKLYNIVHERKIYSVLRMVITAFI